MDLHARLEQVEVLVRIASVQHLLEGGICAAIDLEFEYPYVVIGDDGFIGSAMDSSVLAYRADACDDEDCMEYCLIVLLGILSDQLIGECLEVGLEKLHRLLLIAGLACLHEMEEPHLDFRSIHVVCVAGKKVVGEAAADLHIREPEEDHLVLVSAYRKIAGVVEQGDDGIPIELLLLDLGDVEGPE